MKLLFIDFLTLSLVLTGPWRGAYTQTLDSSSEELTEEFEIPTILRFAFLKEMATRTLLFQEMNRERLIHAHECLKAGTCPELLAQIKNNITALFPVYRHYLALVNLVGRSQILLH